MNKQNKLEKLNLLMEKADNYRGVHALVEKRKIYSGNAIRMHRSSVQFLSNESKINQLIEAYGFEIKKIEEKIKNININL